MRLRRLDLLSFGPFSGERLDFGDGRGLFFVLGPNEAGKSSSLRALSQFLYGIPHRPEDAFLHKPSDLAIGGVVARDDGELSLIRKKRPKNDLVDASGEPFDQEGLVSFMGGVGRDAFASMFGIDHTSLTAGGEEMLFSGGALGQTLFAAASGITSLRALLGRLDEEQRNLFAPRAKLAEIPENLKRLSELNAEKRAALVSTNKWKETKREVGRREERREELQTRREELLREASRLERLLAASGPARLRRELLAELENLGPAPDLGPDFTERRSRHQLGLADAGRDVERLGAVVKDLDARLEALAVDEGLVHAEGVVHGLYRRVEIHEKALSDAGKRRAEAEGLGERARALLAGLRPGLALERAEELLVPRSEQARIRGLVERHTALSTEQAAAAREAGELERELAAARAALGGLDEARDTGALAEAVERAAGRGDVEDRLAEARGGCGRLRARAGEALSALGLWRGGLDAVAALAVPPQETMRRFERELEAADGALAEAGRREAELAEQLAERGAALDALRRAADVPAEADLDAARAVRDAGWNAVRARLERRPDAAVEEEFLARCNPETELAPGFEGAMRQADEVADRLRREAEGVARRAELEAGAERLSRDCEAAASRTAEARQAREELGARWAALWAPLGIEPLPPREMQAWDEARREVCRLAGELAGREAEAAALEAAASALRREISGHLAALGEDVADGAALAALLAQARRAVRRQGELRDARREALSRTADLERRRGEAAARLARAEEELAAWRGPWAEAVRPLGLGAEAEPRQAQAMLDDVGDLFTVLADLRDKEKRIAAIGADYEAFAAEVAEAVARLAPDLTGTEARQAALELFERLSRTKAAAQEREHLLTRRAEASEGLDAAWSRLQGHREALSLLCAEAQCDGPQGLEETERRARTRARTAERLAEAEDRLAEAAAGADLDEFASRALEQDPDALTAALDRARADADAVQAELTEVLQKLGAARHALEALDGTSRAAAVAERAQGVMGELQVHVDRYVRLRLAALITAREIEGYRRRNQGPILERASGLFAGLTRDSFSGLEADFDDKGEPVLLGLREDGERVPVTGMSDGTRDQLFLALRLAGLSRYLDNNAPMPFVVDDILVHFDDERAEATLRALADLARRTQVIFFSHHAHLLPLAERAVPEDLLTVLRLGAA